MPPFDLEANGLVPGQKDDLLKQVMRASMAGPGQSRSVRTSPTTTLELMPDQPNRAPTNTTPLPYPNGVQPTPPALDTNLMWHAMSAGVKTLPNSPKVQEGASPTGVDFASWLGRNAGVPNYEDKVKRHK